MAFAGVRCGGYTNSMHQRLPICARDRNFRPCCSLRVENRTKSRFEMSMMTTTTHTVAPAMVERGIRSRSEKDRKSESVVSDKQVDKWMKESVAEIVKNLRQAPLLVHVYEEEDENRATMRTEKAVEEETWSRVMEEWRNGSARKPEGVIFVEQLKDVDEEEEEEEAWGVVVQGRGGGGVESGPPACYLLKISRARCGPGVGLFCTHFCLVKVANFKETASSQLKNCWLAMP